MRLSWLGLNGAALGWVLCGCHPSLAKLSSGQVGCRSNDVVVRDIERSASGLDTWVAECRGRSYSCSRLGPNTSCTELTAESSSTSGTRSTRPETDSAGKGKPSQALEGTAPEGVAGFSFGATQAEVQAACSGAGHEWKALSSERYLCSGSVKAFALSVSAALQFCEAKVCSVTLVHRPEQHWYETFEQLHGALEKKYGPSTSKDVKMDRSCVHDRRMPKCLLHAAAHARYRWDWQGGQSVELAAEQPTPQLDGERYPSLRLHYATSAAQRELGTDGKLELDL